MCTWSDGQGALAENCSEGTDPEAELCCHFLICKMGVGVRERHPALPKGPKERLPTTSLACSCRQERAQPWGLWDGVGAAWVAAGSGRTSLRLGVCQTLDTCFLFGR